MEQWTIEMICSRRKNMELVKLTRGFIQGLFLSKDLLLQAKIPCVAGVLCHWS